MVFTKYKFNILSHYLSLCLVSQENFDVDTFLQDHRKNGKLETMRDDLGMYLKLLRSAMIDLINRDYTDFVNLSSNLIGLDKAINDLQVPLGQLREEVMVRIEEYIWKKYLRSLKV